MANVLIVGGGAAGLMAAGAAVRQGHKVTVLEHMDKPGQKILVTGKGRCNVTNDCTAEEFLRHVRTNPRFLFSSLGAFPPAKTMELFAEAAKTAKTVVWNGPMGVFENPVLKKGTVAVCEALAAADATTIIGGGDSATAAINLGYADKMSHISTCLLYTSPSPRDRG